MITATLMITVGLSFYGGADFINHPLYCGGTYLVDGDPWAAVAVEWFKQGYVHCGDTLFATFKDGRQVEVPIRDAGCHLHWPVYDTGLPFGADFPSLKSWRNGTPTGTGQIAVRHKDGSWWTPPPLRPWYGGCEGPLSRGEERTWDKLEPE